MHRSQRSWSSARSPPKPTSAASSPSSTATTAHNSSPSPTKAGSSHPAEARRQPRTIRPDGRLRGLVGYVFVLVLVRVVVGEPNRRVDDRPEHDHPQEHHRDHPEPGPTV